MYRMVRTEYMENRLVRGERTFNSLDCGLTAPPIDDYWKKSKRIRVVYSLKKRSGQFLGYSISENLLNILGIIEGLPVRCTFCSPNAKFAHPSQTSLDRAIIALFTPHFGIFVAVIFSINKGA